MEPLLVDLHKKEAYKHRQEEYALEQVLELAQVPQVNSPIYLLNAFLLLTICPLPNTGSLVEQCGLLRLNFLILFRWLDQLYANHRLIVSEQIVDWRIQPWQQAHIEEDKVAELVSEEDF